MSLKRIAGKKSITLGAARGLKRVLKLLLILDMDICGPLDLFYRRALIVDAFLP